MAVNHLEPYDSSNSENEPWLLNSNLDKVLIGPEGEKLTANYIWSKQGQERKDLAEWIFQYYRKNGFPKFDMTDNELKLEYAKLRNLDASSILNENGEIKNSNSTCTDVLKHFCGELFYAAKGEKNKTKSCVEVFNNDELLMAVLKNRSGWNSSKEDGRVRPYVFSMSDEMLIQGMRSSGLAYTVSTFKPVIAKFVYEKYVPKNGRVWDYSAGWGARSIAAGSLDMEYYGFDPSTYNHINQLMNFFNIKGKVFGECSENTDAYSQIGELKNTFDISFSSPPYFVLENYSSKETQSDIRYSNYEEWLDKFWKKLAENNIEFILKPDGIFGVVIVEKVKKHQIGQDMISICEKLGLSFIEKIPFKTSRSHLSSKKETKSITKTTEGIYLFKK